jgi:glycosyltransferase involved in cell wall biosynthesis
MSPSPSIVVLTPLKNDAWILRRFLEVTSAFADHVIIADQGSTDGGLEICREFPKVTVIDNSASDYDENKPAATAAARGAQTVPMPRLLLASTATRSSPQADGDARMAGTARGGRYDLLFEKPNLYLSPARCERRPLDFPGGFVDDDLSPHRPQRIHSPRLPSPPNTPQLILGDVKFLHYALVRPEAQKAKMRMYAALENVMGTKSLYTRRRYYWSRKVLRPMGPVEPTPPEWLAAWEARHRHDDDRGRAAVLAGRRDARSPSAIWIAAILAR